ncbi:MAG: hypothetical protein J6Y60_09925 [Treponema sp.]|nr:hypothetical protein [Treponema sp.]
MKAPFFRTCAKKTLLSLLICLNMVILAHAGDWVLAAREFTFTQSLPHSQSELSLCKMIPSLILEQLNTDTRRIPSADELNSRKYEELLQKRQSLFLELSAAVKRRDSVMVQEANAKTIKKKIAEEEKKIAELEKKIQENLDESAKYLPESNPNAGAVSDSAENEVEVLPGAEKLVLYKNESSSLYVPSKEAMAEGVNSRRYEKAVIDSKINALVSGSITIYGNYLSVSAELILYPGAKPIATVMEVGSMDDIGRLSRSVAQKILPVIANTTGTSLHFEIEPAELASKARVTVDGLPVKIDNPVIVPSSTHTIEIQCQGYVTQTVTYLFQDSPHFVIHVPLKEQSEGSFSVMLKEPVDGQLYFNSTAIGNAIEGAQVSINGRNIIGQLALPDKDTFFLIPPTLQMPEANLVVPAVPQDLNAEIEKRRIWSYRGYTALILTLPFTFYSMGHYNSAANAYMSASIPYEEVHKWDVLRWTSLGLTVAAAGFFVYELVRYLCTANKALPVKAREAKPGELEEINARVFQIKNDVSSDPVKEDSAEDGQDIKE